MLPLVAALQLAAASASPVWIVVKDATATQRVALVATPAGPMVSPERLAPMLDIRVKRSAPGRFLVRVNGVSAAMEAGVTSVRIADQVRQLATAPVERNQRLLVPLQFVTELLPAFVSNVRWDGATQELVVFSKLPSRRAARPEAKRETERAAPTAAPTVVVDAGHGGPDNGMTGPIGGPTSLYEKDITLSVSKRLGRELRSRGFRVVYTRSTDTLIALSDRGRIANQSGGNLFISVHVNAANLGWRDPAAARGFETYFLAEARTEDARRVEQMENESVRFESAGGVRKDDPLSYILSDMKQNEHLRESAELAEIVQRHLGEIHPGPDRGVKQAGFRVLVTAFMPSVLVEIGFGTNAAEAKYLRDGGKQDAIAKAIADAALEYQRAYERRVQGGGSDR